MKMLSRGLSGISSWLLDPPETTQRWGAVEIVLVAIWAGVVAFAVHQHVPWADEMQAWFLAGDVGWKRLLFHSLRYEGTGGLWHSFLKVCQEAHLSFFAARYLAAAMEGAAMALLLRDAPLPRAVRYLLPFTFFLLYQDAVVARSYCLLALPAFLAAKLLRAGRPRPVYLALLLGLMANISAHGAFLSGGLAIVAAVTWGRKLLRNPAALALLLALWTMACIAMAPAYDINYEAGNNLRRSFAKAEQAVGIHAAPPPRIIALAQYGLPSAAPVARKRNASHAFTHRVDRLFAIVTFPLSSFRLAALLLAVLLVGLAMMNRQRIVARSPGNAPLGMLGLLPWAGMVLIFSSLYLAPRHAGTVFTGFVVSAWLVWPGAAEMTERRRWTARAAVAVWCLLCIESVAWSAHAITKEHALPYSPGKMTAEFLKSRGVGQAQRDMKVAGFYYFPIDALLYFPRNIYFNQPPHRYWLWSTSMLSYSTARQVLEAHPRYIVVGGMSIGPESEITNDWYPADTGPAGVVLDDRAGVVPYFEEHGYQQTHIFCGHSWMRGSYGEQICDRVLEPLQTQQRAR